MTADEELIRAARKHVGFYAGKLLDRNHRVDALEALILRYRQHCSVSDGSLADRNAAHERIAAKLKRELKTIAGDEFQYDPVRPIETECETGECL